MQNLEDAGRVILAQDSVKSRYSPPRGTELTFETDLKKNTTTFIGSVAACLRGSVPTQARYADERVILGFSPAVAGCEQLQYRFHPVTGAGEIFVSTDGGTSWVPSTGGGSVALIR